MKHFLRRTRLPTVATRQFTRGVSSSSTPLQRFSANTNKSGEKGEDYNAKVALAGVVGLGALSISSNRNGKVVKCEQVDCGPVSEWNNGDFKSIKGPDERFAVVVKYRGKFYATTNKSAQGFLLEQGLVGSDGTIIDKLHHSAYDLKTGKPTRGPSMTAIGTYPVKVENDRVYCDISDAVPMFTDAPMVRRDPANKKVVAIIGAGAAGLACAETLRQEGYTGRIVLISQEKHAPYSRVICSKVLTKKSKDLELRSRNWLDEHDIEFRASTKVTAMDSTERILKFEGTEEDLQYDDVLIATGCQAREVFAPGYDLGNIFRLRSVDDAHDIAKMTLAHEKPRVMIIGASFIGMEVASTLTSLGAEVTMVGLETMPYERVLGRKVGAAFALLLDKAGVEFIGNKKVTLFRGDYKVRKVEMEDGDKIKTDIVVLGAGVIPNTGAFTDVQKSRDGGIVVDPFLQSLTSEHVYAAGDVATFPYWRSGQNIRVEHWDAAIQQGRLAAKNMLGQMKPYKAVPFFWSEVFDSSMRYVGWTDRYDEVHVEGNALQQDFVAYYLYKGDIVSVASMGNEEVTAAVSDLMAANKMPSANDIICGKVDGTKIVALQKELAASSGCCGGKKKSTKVSSSWLSGWVPSFLSGASA